jgi:hypothetical protein
MRSTFQNSARLDACRFSVCKQNGNSDEEGSQKPPKELFSDQEVEPGAKKRPGDTGPA